MKPVREVISRDIIDDLWGAGYTILPRRRHPDPFHVPPEMVPQGRSYQWWHLVHDKVHFESASHNLSGWAPVPASRHDGYFMPAGHVGDIEVNGLGLFEKSKYEVDQAKAQQVATAHQQVHDWKKVTGSMFSGEFSVGGETSTIGDVDTAALLKRSAKAYETPDRGMYADATSKTIETTTAIPRDMVPYIDKIFAERDRLAKDYLDVGQETKWAFASFETHMMENPSAPKWPTLHAILLPTAIENVRKQIKEAASGEAS